MCGHLLKGDFVWQGRWGAVFAESVEEDALRVIAPMMVVLLTFWYSGQAAFADLMEFGVGWTRVVLVVTIAGCGLSVEHSLTEVVEGCNGGKY